GLNGANKSTCFNVLTDHFPPDRDEVILDRENITRLSARQIAQKGISRSFQTISLFDEFTALENVLLALPAVRSQNFNVVRDISSDSATVARTLEILAQVGLAPNADARSTSLSYGDRRTLEIAVALAAHPRVLFLDEPTQSMRTEGRRR